MAVEQMIFGDVRFPGFALRGLHPDDPPLTRSAFKHPGVSATTVITLGLGERRIVVPYLLTSPQWRTYEAVQAFLRRLEAVKAAGRQGSLQINHASGRTQFDACYFDGFRYDPADGILPDVAGTLGGYENAWFVEGAAMFVQVKFGGSGGS